MFCVPNNKRGLAGLLRLLSPSSERAGESYSRATTMMAGDEKSGDQRRVVTWVEPVVLTSWWEFGAWSWIGHLLVVEEFCSGVGSAHEPIPSVCQARHHHLGGRSCPPTSRSRTSGSVGSCKPEVGAFAS